MRLLGVLLALAGALGLVYSVRGTFTQSRPKDVAFAMLALVCTMVALLGLALAFVPGFLG